MAEPASLKSRRNRALGRLEIQRAEWADHYDGLVQGTRAWAGSPQSLVQAALAGIMADQALAFIRYRILATSVLRPLGSILQTLVRANRLL